MKKAQLIDVGTLSMKSIHVKLVEQTHLTSPFHFHEMCELVYIKNGNGKRIVGDHVDDFSNGDLVLLGPNLPHIWLDDNAAQKTNSDSKIRSVVIYFSPYLLSDLAGEASSVVENLITRAQRGIQFYGKTLEQVICNLNELKREYGLKKVSSFLHIIDTLAVSEEYRSLASITYKNLYNRMDTDRMSTLYKFLNENFREEISLDEAAAIVNMSQGAFCRFFKSRTQKSFTMFVNELRIGYACKLLRNQDQSITAIAFECGYQNLTNFNKFFKRIMRKTPTQYKKEITLSVRQAMIA